MNWLIKLRPRIRIPNFLRRSTAPKDFWVKCPKTGGLAPRTEVEKNLWVFPESGYHFPLSAHQRLAMTFDGPWEDIPVLEVSTDPLKFRDRKRHKDRLKEVRKIT